MPLSVLSYVPRGAAGNLERGAGDEARRRRAEEGDGVGRLFGRPEPPEWNVVGARNLAVPLLARLLLVLAHDEAALPLAGVDKPDQHRVDADVRREFARQRLDQALRAGARRRGRD